MNSKNRPNCSKRSKGRFLSYKITDPSLYSRHPLTFKKRLILSKKADMTLLRDKTNPKLRYLAKHFKNCRIDSLKLISSDLNIARRFAYAGIHLPSSSLHRIYRARASGLLVVASTHNENELRQARKGRAHLITYSPIFSTPGKGAPKGVRALRKKMLYKNIIALGGIVGKREIVAVRRSQAAGFAAIRYFLG